MRAEAMAAGARRERQENKHLFMQITPGQADIHPWQQGQSARAN